MLSRRAARLSAQLAGRALAGEPARTCVRGAHGGRPDNDVHATTVLCVRKDGQASVGLGFLSGAASAALATGPPCSVQKHSCSGNATAAPKQVVLVADGQVTMGGTVVKPNVRKTRKIGEHVIGGFAGAAVLSGQCCTNQPCSVLECWNGFLGVEKAVSRCLCSADWAHDGLALALA